MKRSSLILAILILFLLSSCSILMPVKSTTTQNEAQATTCVVEPAATCDPNAGQPVLYGMWMQEPDEAKSSDRAMLTVTASSVYLVEKDGTAEAPYVRELFYEIRSVDWVNSVVTMKLKWVRVNGKYSGFSTPLNYLKVNIDGNTLFYSLGDEGLGIPTEALTGPFIRK